jgi:hypothetical protein
MTAKQRPRAADSGLCGSRANGSVGGSLDYERTEIGARVLSVASAADVGVVVGGDVVRAESSPAGR